MLLTDLLHHLTEFMALGSIHVVSSDAETQNLRMDRPEDTYGMYDCIKIIKSYQDFHGVHSLVSYERDIPS